MIINNSWVEKHEKKRESVGLMRMDDEDNQGISFTIESTPCCEVLSTTSKDILG